MSGRAREAIEAYDNTILASVASLWEIAIKHGLGKMSLHRPFAELVSDELERQQIGVLPMEAPHLTTFVSLPLHHRDPLDRIIAAQALSESLPVLSADKALDPYGVRRIW